MDFGKRKRDDEEISNAISKDLTGTVENVQNVIADRTGNLVRNKKIKTPRGRLNEYIRKDVMAAITDGDIEGKDAPESMSPFKQMLVDLDEQKLPYLPDWDDLWGTENQFFIFSNRLSGQYTTFKRMSNTRTMDDLIAVLTPDAASHAKEIGLSLPFPMFSIFLSMDMLSKCLAFGDLRLVTYNSDVEKAKRFMEADEENGKIAYNPYFVLMDKFTHEFIKTGAAAPLFNVAREVDRSNLIKSIAFTHMICYLMADVYPPEHSDHRLAMDIRHEILTETSSYIQRCMQVQVADQIAAAILRERLKQGAAGAIDKQEDKAPDIENVVHDEDNLIMKD